MEGYELELLENPDYDLDYYEPPRRKRRRCKSTELVLNPLDPKFKFTPMTIGLLCVAGYFIWCAINRWRTGSWSWQPWKSLLGSRRLLARTTGTVPYSAPRVYETSSTQVVHRALSPTDETISLITP